MASPTPERTSELRYPVALPGRSAPLWLRACGEGVTCQGRVARGQGCTRLRRPAATATPMNRPGSRERF